MAIDEKKFLADQKWKANTIKELMISEGKGGSPGTPTPDWDKDWPPKPKPQPKPKLAGAQDIDTKMHILPSGMMVDENGIKYMWSPREKKFIDMGPYDPYYDGNPIPFGQRNTIDDMKIAKKKPDEQRAYEDFVRDSQNMPLDESFKDLRRGQDGEGFDILHRLLDLDEAKNRLKINQKVAEKRLPFINIDNLEDPVRTLRDGGYPDPDVMDFPSGGNYRKGSNVLDRLIDLELVNKMKINPKVAMADKMYRVTDWDKKQNNEAWKQFMKGNPNYFYKPVKGKA